MRTLSGCIGAGRAGTMRAVGLCAMALAAGTADGADEIPAARIDGRTLSIGLVAEKPAQGRFVKTGRGYMVPYTATVPGTGVEFEMVPIPGGTFRVGSPANEQGRQADEGPQFTVRIEPFWMGKHEVIWGEYASFRDAYLLHEKIIRESEDDPRLGKSFDEVDAVTTPTVLWDIEFHMMHGRDQQLPATTMTQFAAKQYTKWISGLTGEFHRLPTEAEWEYASRAGTTTAYSFGDDPKQLDDHAWHAGNSGEKTHIVGRKAPNDWGLHDMHGNVMEWVLDQYDAKSYARFGEERVSALDAVRWPTKLESRVLRGGSYEGIPAELRSAARFESQDEDWLKNDIDVVQSATWYTEWDTLAVGFRLHRPLDPPPADQRGRFWNPDAPDMEGRIKARWDMKGGGLLKADQRLVELMKSMAREGRWKPQPD